MIEQLTGWCETRRQEVVNSVLIPTQGQAVRRRLHGDREGVRRFQNQFLHGPISALTEETHAGAASGYTLVEALLKLFRLPE